MSLPNSLTKNTGDQWLGPQGAYARIRGLAPGQVEGDAVEYSQMFAAIAAAIVSAGAGILPVTYAQLAALATAGTIVQGQVYFITDRGDEGIYVRGATGTTVSREAILNALNADYGMVGNYSGVPSAGTQLGVWRTNIIQINYSGASGYFSIGESITNALGGNGTVLSDDGSLMQIENVDDVSLWGDLEIITGANSGTTATQDSNTPVYVPAENDMMIYNNNHYINITGMNDNGSTPTNTNWTILTKAVDTGFIRVADFIIYDFENDIIAYRCDRVGNQVWGGISAFPWGNEQAVVRCSITGGNIFMSNLVGTASDLIIVGGSIGVSGYTGSLTSSRFYNASVDLTNARLTSVYELDLCNGANLNLAGARGQVSSVKMDNGLITATGLQHGSYIDGLTIINYCELDLGPNFLGSITDFLIEYSNVTIPSTFDGAIQQVRFTNGCNITLGGSTAYYTNVEIALPVTVTLNTGDLTDKSARVGYSNFEANIIATGNYALKYKAATGTFTVGNHLQNLTSGGTATVAAVNDPYLLLNDVVGSWSDNDQFDNGGSPLPPMLTSAIVDGTPDFCSVITYDNLAVSNFLVGESVTDLTTLATGTVVFDDGVSLLGLKQVVGYFLNNDPIQGGASGTTADVDGAPQYLSLNLDLATVRHAGIINVSLSTSQEPISDIVNAPEWFPYKFFPAGSAILNFVHGSTPTAPRLFGATNVSLSGNNDDWIEFESRTNAFESAIGQY